MLVKVLSSKFVGVTDFPFKLKFSSLSFEYDVVVTFTLYEAELLVCSKASLEGQFLNKTKTKILSIKPKISLPAHGP